MRVSFILLTLGTSSSWTSPVFEAEEKMVWNRCVGSHRLVRRRRRQAPSFKETSIRSENETINGGVVGFQFLKACG